MEKLPILENIIFSNNKWDFGPKVIHNVGNSIIKNWKIYYLKLLYPVI